MRRSFAWVSLGLLSSACAGGDPCAAGANDEGTCSGAGVELQGAKQKAPGGTTITSAPADPSGADVVFSFVSSVKKSTFSCSLDGNAFAPCSSPLTFAALTDGAHRFQVRATDSAGNPDRAPASYSWTVDTTAPDTTLTSVPPDPSGSSVTFAFVSSERGSTFSCSLDGNAFAPCTSPLTFTGLIDGAHLFQVRATDSAGNPDPAPASYPWTVFTVPPVPKFAITIDGEPYTAYQRPGETFRVVCHEPCPLPEDYLFAKSAGFKAAKDKLMTVTGIDVLPRNVPVDLHLAADPLCPATSVVAGTSGTSATGGSHLCLYALEQSMPTDPSYVPIPLTVDMALALTQQVLAVHEYTHVIFCGRHAASYEDFVTPMSFFVTGVAFGGGLPTTSLCESRWDIPGSGKLFHDLCVQIGLDFGDLAESLRQLDAAYQANPEFPTSMFVYRRILTELRQADMAVTFQIYLDSQWLPVLIGDSATLLPTGGTVSMYGGRVILEVPEGALASPFFIDTFWPLDITDLGQPLDWYDFGVRSSFWFVGEYAAPLPLARAVKLTIAYDPALVPAGVPESSLRLYLAISNPRVEVPGSTVDTVAHTVSAMVSTLDRYAVEPTSSP